jgi:hypothetical protein
MYPRREFIIQATKGIAGAFIFPSFAERLLNHIDRHGVPLLETPKNSSAIIYAVHHYDSEYQLCYGDPFEEPPQLTWRQYFMEEYGSKEHLTPELLEDHGIELGQLDEECNARLLESTWEISWSPQANAFHYLGGFDLGSDLSGQNSELGAIDFIQGPYPGSNYTGAHATSLAAIGCLQHRLNQLGENTEIQILN